MVMPLKPAEVRADAEKPRFPPIMVVDLPAPTTLGLSLDVKLVKPRFEGVILASASPWLEPLVSGDVAEESHGLIEDWRGETKAVWGAPLVDFWTSALDSFLPIMGN